jgi:hypothetical protein
MRTNARFPVVFLAAVFGAMLSGCGGGGGAGLDPAASAAWCGDGSSCSSVAGRWSLELTSAPLSNNCGDPPGTFTFHADITQSGCSLEVALEETQIKLEGTITGDRVCWSGSYPDSDGIMTIDAVRITVADDGQSASGTLDYSWRQSQSHGCGGHNTVHLQLLE